MSTIEKKIIHFKNSYKILNHDNLTKIEQNITLINSKHTTYSKKVILGHIFHNSSKNLHINQEQIVHDKILYKDSNDEPYIIHNKTKKFHAPEQIINMTLLYKDSNDEPYIVHHKKNKSIFMQKDVNNIILYKDSNNEPYISHVKKSLNL